MILKREVRVCPISRAWGPRRPRLSIAADDLGGESAFGAPKSALASRASPTAYSFLLARHLQMRWSSRRLRNLAAPRVAITFARAAEHSISSDACIEQWDEVFALVDSRRLPTTWAIVDGCSPWVLGNQLVAGQASHELGFVDREGNIAPMVAEFRRQAAIASQVQLPLRTMVSESAGLHPSLLAQLEVNAVVPIRPEVRSRTGTLRAVAWNIWEAPVTTTVSRDSPQVERLAEGLDAAVRQSTEIHVVVKLGKQMPTATINALSRFFGLAADYHARGWIRVETVGQSAAQLSLATNRTAA